MKKLKHFDDQLIQTRDAVLINSSYGSSGLFGSRVGSMFIGHNTYTQRRSHFHSKPTPIHGPVNKSELIFHNRSFTLIGYHKQFLKNWLIFI